MWLRKTSLMFFLKNLKNNLNLGINCLNKIHYECLNALNVNDLIFECP